MKTARRKIPKTTATEQLVCSGDVLRNPSESPVANSNPSKSAASQNKKVPPPKRIVQLVEEARATLFHSANFESFATIWVKDHWETWRLRDATFKRWLAGLYYHHEEEAASTESISAALNVLQAKAQHDGPEKQVHVRVAGHEGRIYVDLADRLWGAIEITGSGWKLVSQVPVKFRRTRGMLPLPIPVRGDLSELRGFVNVSNQDHFVLIAQWLLASFRPTGPYPLLVLEGNQGTAKSTTSRLLRSLIDPHTTPLRSLPRDERDLMISASNSWCQVFENVSDIPFWMSDCLCRLSTGGGFSKRQNYEDDEEMLFDVMRPVIINGISVGIERADLLDRSLIIPSDELPDERRMTEREFWDDVDRARPRILGGILDAASCAMRELPNVTITRLPRMADFARWATAAEPALGYAHGAFLEAYNQNRQQANHLALDSSLLVPHIKGLMEESVDWSGTATELLQDLRDQAAADARQLPGLPKTAGALSGELRRLVPSLRTIGIEIQLSQTAGAGSRKIITIRSLSAATLSPGKKPPATGPH